MADPDFIWTEGWDHYWPAVEDSSGNFDISPILGERYSTGNFGGKLRPKPPLTGTTGCSMEHASPGGGQASRLDAPLPANYARCIGGATFSATPYSGSLLAGWGFFDSAANPTNAQIWIGVNSSGNIVVKRGGTSLGFGTLIATSTEVTTDNSVHYIAWDITFHSSAGIIKIWLDNVLTSINLTGINTSNTGNPYFNAFCPIAVYQMSMRVDHSYLYCYTASGGSELPILTSPIIETQFENGDSSVTFSVGAGVLGDAGSAYVTNTSSAPGANRLVLRQFTPPVGGTLSSIGVIPRGTAATAKFKAVLYSDSAGSPNSLVATGTEVVGATSGTTMSLPFASGQALTGGTAYWIGYITDTSINMQQYDTATTLGQSKANTYTSGAPNPAGTMTTGQPTWLIWGNLSSVSAKWPQQAVRYASTLSYNYSSTVGNTDLFSFPALIASASAIHCVSLLAALSKSDAGARTINLVTKSSTTSDNGTLGTYSPPLSLQYTQSNWLNDPNTGSAWLPASVNAATGGYKIAA